MTSTHTIHQNSILLEASKGTHRSIILLAQIIIEDACVQGASDIHLHPIESALPVKLRIDGLLREQYTLPRNCHTELIARFKILAGLRTDEHLNAQDGRFTHHRDTGELVPVRVSTIPTHHGENIVLRILASSMPIESLTGLGMSSADQHRVQAALSATHGLIVVSGSTGSGKTTTLYALMRMLGAESLSLVSIEDPVEYSLPGVTQIQVQPTAGLTFSAGLRAVLRQDPDVIMVGEIRDADTARLALTSALTGHKVFSTLHTNDARSVLPRLQEMGVSQKLICSTLRIVIAQRLVRRICTSCKETRPATLPEQEYLRRHLPENAAVPDALFTGRGCNSCNDTGYRGRIGIFEVVPFLKGEWGQSTSLFRDGLEKARAGHTTLEEIRSIRYA